MLAHGRPLVIEFWDTWSGEVIERRVETLAANRRVALPNFYHDLAVKVWIAPADTSAVELRRAPRLQTAAPLTTM